MEVLLEAAAQGNTPLVEVVRVLYSSPPMHSKHVVSEASGLGYQQKIKEARIKADVNKIAHQMFSDSTHLEHCFLRTMKEMMRNRWCKYGFLRLPVLLGSRWNQEALLGTLAQRSLTKLKLLSRWVPPRVHISNVRLHFNGWHTEARYQRRVGIVCISCQREDSEDSIEHILRCPCIQDIKMCFQPL